MGKSKRSGRSHGHRSKKDRRKSHYSKSSKKDKKKHSHKHRSRHRHGGDADESSSAETEHRKSEQEQSNNPEERGSKEKAEQGRDSTVSKSKDVVLETLKEPSVVQDAGVAQLLEIFMRNEEMEQLRMKYREQIVDRPVRQTKEEIAQDEAPVHFSAFGLELHQNLRYLWLPMQYMLRTPYSVKMDEKSFNFAFQKCHFFYIFFLFQSVITGIVFVLLVGALFCVYFVPHPANTMGKACDKRHAFNVFASKALFRRYLLEVVICVLMLLYAVCSNISQVLYKRKYAIFCKDWYRLVEKCKIRIHFGVRRYIFEQLILIGVMLVAIVLVWCLPQYGFKVVPPSIYGASGVMGLALVHLWERVTIGPIQSNILIDDPQMTPRDLKEFAPIGLLIYIFGVFQGQMSLLLYRVSCRLLSNAGKYYKVRLNHLLSRTRSNLADVNLRLSYPEMHHDLIRISEQGKRIGNVFDTLLLLYYSLLFFSLLVELSVLSFDAYRDRVLLYRRNTNLNCAWDPYLGNGGAIHDFQSHCSHLFFTVVDFVLLTFTAVDASEEAMRGHELVRRHGLLNCVSELERNFIRSMWCLGDLRRPIIISPGNYFDIDKAFIANLIQGLFVYYVVILQLRPEFQRNANLRDDELKKLFNLPTCNATFQFNASCIQ